MILASVSIFLAIAYAGLIFAYCRAWRKIPHWALPEGFLPKASITVLIPVRNEAVNIGACLQSILQGSYPPNLLEIIVLDDFSEDDLSGQLPESVQTLGRLKTLKLSDHLPSEARYSANKKKAIELGVARASGEIIVTTDADCVVPKDWLLLIAAYFEVLQPKMLCAPVNFFQEKNLFQRFQSLDFLGMMGVTGAGYQLGWHQMANGANLAYQKDVFEAVGGYTGNTALASGDDMFLVQKVNAHWPGSVVFLKNQEATVQTEASHSLSSFWQQRIRWGAKNAALPSWGLRLSLLLVLLFCWDILINLALTIAGIVSWKILLFQIVVKAAFDFFFLFEMCRFFKREDLIRWFWPSFFLHTTYIAFIGAASILFKKYEWKGRQTK